MKLFVVGALLVTLAACSPARHIPATTTTAHPATTVQINTCPLGQGRCPDPVLTPGNLYKPTTTRQGVCPPRASELEPRRFAASPDVVATASGEQSVLSGRDPRRQLTASQKRTVLKRYGFPAGTDVVEYDHLIAWWAGGSSSPANVWPSLNEADKRRKDALEYHLFRQVCVDRTLSLGMARGAMLAFWANW